MALAHVGITKQQRGGVDGGGRKRCLTACKTFASIWLTMAPENRTEPVGLRMSPEELTMLRALAELDGISQSDVLRMLLRREWMARFGMKMPSQKKKK